MLPHRPDDAPEPDSTGNDRALVVVLLGGLLILLAVIALVVLSGEARRGARRSVEPVPAVMVAATAPVRFV